MTGATPSPTTVLPSTVLPTTVLVANRGEIAVRVFRTARRMGLRCVAVYSDADADAPFVRLADAAVRLGPAPAAESYLCLERIIEAALRTGAELVHPGFGFLSEDPAFARACEKAGLTFVGPPPAVLAAMGAKAQAKLIAEAAGVPVLPGYAGSGDDDEALAAAAEEIGYPVIVKPEAGGGGKGMAVVRGPAELGPAVLSARRLAAAAFGDTRLLLERYLPVARHVEVQVIADAHGGVLHLGERDCSLQRRHQKILEESPAAAVAPELRERLCGAAVSLARHVGYRSAGTCEFLVGDDGSVGFIEMNARLQVEHPVTEAVTGLDLVELQLRVARGEPLGLRQEDVVSSGHAVEVRVYAEDPDEGFLPQAGRVAHLRWPARARVDSGIVEGSEVSTYYDPMLAKLVVHGPDRAEALRRLRAALEETEVLGVRTNLPLLASLAAHPDVAAGRVTTGWLESADGPLASHPDLPDADLPDADLPDADLRGPPAGGRATPGEAVALAAAAQAARLLADAPRSDPWSSSGPWRALGGGVTGVVLLVDGEERLVEVRGGGPFEVGPSPEAGRPLLGAGPHRVASGDGCHAFDVGGIPGAAVAEGGSWHVWWGGRPYELPLGPRVRRVDAEGGPAQLGAPMPGTVIAVRVAPGDRVERGQEMVVVEAMKMELAIKAPSDGVVAAVTCAPGDRVERGQVLVDLEEAPG